MTNLEKLKIRALEWDCWGKKGCSVTIDDDKEIRFEDINEYIAWLLSEYKDPVLDKAEKEYLENVLRPFKDRVVGVRKISACENEEKLVIDVRHFKNNDIYDIVFLPKFGANKMYKGMKIRETYTLKKLGLFEEE